MAVAGEITQPDHEPLELSMRQTGLSFQRTRMSADRTLMSVIRTALSLISFGFTIFQFFRHLEESEMLKGTARAPRNFGGALVWLGVGMLTVGIIYHLLFMRGLRHMRESMKADGLIHGETSFPVSLTLIIAVLLLIVGLFATASIDLRSGPFL
jgi:putative membrane protein